jgi:hypothetical protein
MIATNKIKYKNPNLITIKNSAIFKRERSAGLTRIMRLFNILISK